jgi:hypothetical protein
MRYLVTGGAGFLGSAVVRMLVRGFEHVVNVDSLTYTGNLDSLGLVADAPNYSFGWVDISGGGTEIAANLPRIPSHPIVQSHWIRTRVSSNCEGSRRLADRQTHMVLGRTATHAANSLT